MTHSIQPSSLASILRKEATVTGGVTQSLTQIAPSLSRSVHTVHVTPNNLINSGLPVVASNTSTLGVQVVPSSLSRSGATLASSSLYRSIAPIHMSRNEAPSAVSQSSRSGIHDTPGDISRSGIQVVPSQLSSTASQVTPSVMTRSGVQTVPSNIIRSGGHLVSSNMTRTTVSVAPSIPVISVVPNLMSRNGVPTYPESNVILNNGPAVSYAINRPGVASLSSIAGPGASNAVTLGSSMVPASSGLTVSNVTGSIGGINLQGAVNIQRTMNNVHIVNNIGNAQLISAAGNPAAFSAGYSHQIPGGIFLTFSNEHKFFLYLSKRLLMKISISLSIIPNRSLVIQD